MPRSHCIGHLGVVPPQPRHLPGDERRHDRGRGAAAEPGEEAAQPAQQHQPALPLEGEALAAFINYVILPILVANVLSSPCRTRQDHVIYERSLAVEGGHPQRQEQSLRGGAEHRSWSPVLWPPHTHRHGCVGHCVNVNHVANWLPVNGLSVCLCAASGFQLKFYRR